MGKVRIIIVEMFKKYRFLMKISSLIYSLPSILLLKGRSKNTISIDGVFLKNTKIIIKGINNNLEIASENRLNNCTIYIKGNHCNIKIEKHCILSNLELWIEDDNGRIQIGFRTTIEGGHIAATEGHSITIGEDCMFSHAIVIRNGDSHSIFDKESNQRINSAQNVKIGDHVWLGENAKVLKGSIIQDGSIIATGGIVTGNVESNSIYAGIPAKKIKGEIMWDRER